MMEKEKGCIVNRLSTIRYEIAKSLIPPKRVLPIHEKVLRESILNLNGKCEYCEQNPSSKNFGDHFYSIISGKYPSVYCNDEWNQIPACSTCNSSKNGRHWKIWLTSVSQGNPLRQKDEKSVKRIIEKFEKYDVTMNKFCQKRMVDHAFMDNQMDVIEKALQLVQSNVNRWRIEAQVTEITMALSEVSIDATDASKRS